MEQTHTPGEWKAIAQRARAKLDNIYEENKELVRATLDTGEVLIGSGLVGYVHGRKGYVPKYLGVPLDLGSFLIGKILAFGMTVKKVMGAADVHALSNGPGAYYIGSVGADMGQRALRAAKNPDGTPQAKNRPLTDQEAKDLSADVRTIVAGETKRMLDAHREEIQRTLISQGGQRVSAQVGGQPVSARVFW